MPCRAHTKISHEKKRKFRNFENLDQLYLNTRTIAFESVGKNGISNKQKVKRRLYSSQIDKAN